MESLGFFDPFINSGRDGGHGEDYSGDLLINLQRELIDEGNVVHDSSLAGEILEVCDVLLETIIGGSIGEASGFLDKFREIKASSGLGVKGVESGFEFFVNLSKVFSEEWMEESAILSYHISVKEAPLPSLILLRVVMTLSLSEE